MLPYAFSTSYSLNVTLTLALAASTVVEFLHGHSILAGVLHQNIAVVVLDCHGAALVVHDGALAGQGGQGAVPGHDPLGVSADIQVRVAVAAS